MPSDICLEKKYFREIYDAVDLSLVDLDHLSNFHSVYYPLSAHLYMEKLFFDLVKVVQNKRVLSVGGGIDVAALYLARLGNQVVTVDVSEEAIEKTLDLANKYGLGNRLKAFHLDWEESNITEKFDVAVCHVSLHHMDWEKSLDKVACALENGGMLIALEPVCLSKLVRYVHKSLPFYHMPLSENEYELSDAELGLLYAKFSSVDLYFLEGLTRESVAYCLSRLGLVPLISILSRIDFQLSRLLPFWRFLSSHLVIVARK